MKSNVLLKFSAAVLFATIAILGAVKPANATQGINYGWCRYPGFGTWLGSSFSSTNSVMNNDFSLIHHTGKIGAVRIWLFPDGTSNINLSGQISTTYINNVKAVCQAANNNGLSVYITLFSAWSPGDATSGNEVALWNDDVNPVLAAIIGHYTLSGVDVMNEFDGTGNNLAFAKYMIGQVKSHYSGTAVTASSNQSVAKAISDRSSDGATYIDLHIYTNPPLTLPQNTSGVTGVLGEIGDSTGNAANHTTIDDSALSQASGKGWSSVYAWDYALDDAWEMTNAGQNFGNVSWNSVGTDWSNK